MGGTLTEEQPPPSYSFPATRPVVYRYAGGKYQLLPNIQCDSIARQEGPHAGHARLSYIFDSLNTDYPTRIEHVQPTATGRGIVRSDDRLVVATFTPNGKPLLLFDGFATIPEAGYNQAAEQVSFQAMATPIRCFDTPITKTRWREAGTPTSTSANKLISLRALFNPNGRGNATAATYEAQVKQKDSTYRSYPVFMDPLTTGARRWGLAMAVAYILGEYNDAAYVKNPSLVELVTLLDCWEPKSPDGPIDPADPTTYTKQPIDVNDEDVTNLPWPEAVYNLIARHGFVMNFELNPDQNGLPVWRLKLYKTNNWERLYEKSLTLQKPGQSLDVSKSSVHEVKLAYDYNKIVNSYVLRSKPAEYEVSIMLAPLFTVSSGDTLTLENFKTSASGFDSVRNKYRLFGLDELGTGHWNFGTGATVTTVPSLTKVLGGADQLASQWVQRARPAKGTLFSKDSSGRPRRAVLDFCLASAYSGPVPGVWDGSAASSFTPVKGGWRLLEDQFGIYIDVEDPSRFSYGDHTGAHRGGVLSLVEALNDATKRVYFRLTAVIEGDQTADARAGRRTASPTSFVIQRAVDGSSRYRPQLVSRWSQFGGNQDAFTRDDLRSQVLQAYSRRFATEVPPFAGPVTIPWHTSGYGLGDRITGVDGRAWNLSCTSGKGQGEGAVLPRIVGIEWDWTDGEQTTLHLSDLRVGRDNG